MQFELQHTDSKTKARVGSLHTDHGEIETPIFMPVGTVASVKAMPQQTLLNDTKAKIILGNTYHLYLRPGLDTLEKAGGLHKFMNWSKPILTDSGGYQVYSLAEMRKINEDGVKFRSHIDGSSHVFTPENAIDTQRVIGGDIIMAFDECPPHPCDKDYATKSMHMTHRWLDRCFNQLASTAPKYGYNQTLFPIIQGSVYTDLRKESAEYCSERSAVGVAIGGLSVGEPAPEMYAMTEVCTEIMPEDKARYLMGVGTPINILECIALGVDMFDCVMPSRNARNGMLFTSEGTVNIKNRKWADDFGPIDPNGKSYVDQYYSKAYLRHLFAANELLALHIATAHNLAFYLWLVKEARLKIQSGEFSQWKNEMVEKLGRRL